MGARLASKVAIVTGGASGLGKAIATRFAEEGATVVITDIQTELGTSLAKETGLIFIRQDVTQENQWTSLLEEIQRTHGALHILVNNAGTQEYTSTLDPEESWLLSDWRRLFTVNVESVFLGCRAAIPAIAASGGGSIINISSIAGLMATPASLPYGAGKAAVAHLTKSVAQHCAERRLNIRCNSIHPGIVLTPPFKKFIENKAANLGESTEEGEGRWAAKVPMGDWTQPGDVAAGASFLASDDARHITGAQLIIDGGLVGCDSFHVDLSGR
jgi:NAD(P)-dependent dehydrogenase (short-subunit alcohol dehydrogenase family)